MIKMKNCLKLNFNIPYELVREKHNIKTEKMKLLIKITIIFKKVSLKDYAINFAKTLIKLRFIKFNKIFL